MPELRHDLRLEVHRELSARLPGLVHEGGHNVPCLPAKVGCVWICLAIIWYTSCSAIGDDKPKQKKKKKEEAGEINPIGQPHFDEGKGTVYTLWYDEGVWHIRMTAKAGKGKEMFTGSIHIDGGSILNAGVQGLERAKKAQDADWVVIHNNRNGCDFQIANFGKSDGFDFKVTDNAKTITFKLLIGGGEHPQRIRIGKENRHPEKVPFQLPAHPGRPKTATEPSETKKDTSKTSKDK